MICNSSFPKLIPGDRSEKNEIHLNIGKMTAVPPDRNRRFPLLFLLPSSMTGLTGFPFTWKDSLEENRLYGEIQPVSLPKCRKRSTR
jgi:hypothetical protein